MATDRPHGCNLRKGRFSEASRVYLITTVTRGREPLLADWHSGRLVVQTMRNEGDRADTLAFVVMPDHFHWLLQLKAGATLEGVLDRVKSVSAHKINALLKRKGSIWQEGYYDHALRKEENLPATAWYVISNPVRSGLVGTINDYPLWDCIWTENDASRRGGAPTEDITSRRGAAPTNEIRLPRRSAAPGAKDET